MKKQVTFWTALLFVFCAKAQNKIIAESNGLWKKGVFTPGSMLYQSYKLSDHLLGTHFGSYEYSHGEHLARITLGIGYANKRNTLAAGGMLGTTAHFADSSALDARTMNSFSLTTCIWAYAEEGRMSAAIIFINLEAYLIEYGIRLNKESAKWIVSAVTTNHGQNYGLGPEIYNRKSGMYAYISPTWELYDLNKKSTGKIEAGFKNPIHSHVGVHVTAGVRFPHSKTKVVLPEINYN